jgi:hypothetical protein
MTPHLARFFERLEASRARALALLDPHDREALNRPPRPGRWSALQVLHHVVESEAATLGYVRKKMQAGSALPRAGLASRLRRTAVALALASPLRFRAPAVVATVPDEVDPARLRERWEAVRGDLRELLDTFPPEVQGRLVFRHPVGGRLGLADTLAVLQAHLDHHLPQVGRAVIPRDSG